MVGLIIQFASVNHQFCSGTTIKPIWVYNTHNQQGVGEELYYSTQWYYFCLLGILINILYVNDFKQTSRN